MKSINKFFAALLVCLALANVAHATTSTINPAVPAQNSPLLSSVLRANFQAAVNDINNLWIAVTTVFNSASAGIVPATGGVDATHYLNAAGGWTIPAGGGSGSPGGTSGQLQWNNAGAFAGLTMSGDCTMVTSTGVITCLKSNGSVFGTAAFQNTAAFLQSASNLSDLANAATARTNLGLGTAATQNSSAFLQATNNLSDVGSASSARTNLGLGTASTQNSTFFSQVANNLSDLTSASTARTNLALGSSATVNTGTSGATIGLLNGNNTESGAVTFSNATLTFSGLINGSQVSCLGLDVSNHLVLSTGACGTGGGGGGLTVGTTTIASGTNGSIEFNNAGVLGELATTGTGNVVRATSPTLVTPALGIPSSGTATNLTGLPISTGVSGLGTGVATALAVNTGSAGAVVVNGGALGTPSSGTATNLTGLPISTGVSGLGTGVATLLGGNSSGTGGPAGTASPTFTGTVSAAAITASGVVTELNSVATGTGADTLPTGTAAQRPGSPVNGMIRYDSTATPAVEVYANGVWQQLGLIPDQTQTISYSLAQGDMGGQVNFNGSSLTATIPAISTTVFPANTQSVIANQNAGTLAISTTPTINNCPLTLGKYGWCNLTSNGTSLDGFGFPGFGTITSNALQKFSGTTGISTASSITDDGTTVTTSENLTLSGTTVTMAGIPAGTIAAGKNIGLNSSNQLVTATVGGGAAALSSLTGGTGTNSIDSATNTQTWTWNTLASQIGLALSTNSTAAASNTQELFDIAMSGANGTSAQTTYGMKVANTHTGTTSTNVAASFSASGGATNNIALQIPAGGMTIGTTTPLAVPSGVSSVSPYAVTILGNNSNTYPGLVVRNTGGGASGAAYMGVQDDGTDYTGMQINSSGASCAGCGIYLASKSVTFLTDFSVQNTGTDPVRFQPGGWGTALTMTITPSGGAGAGTVQIGTTTNATNAELTVLGETNSSGFVAGGTKFTASGCTSITSTSGGGTAGKFTIGAATCTVVITMNGATGLTAPTGWSCRANDETTAAGNTGLYFSTNNTTTATLTVPATAAASDVIDFSCVGF